MQMPDNMDSKVLFAGKLTDFTEEVIEISFIIVYLDCHSTLLVSHPRSNGI